VKLLFYDFSIMIENFAIREEPSRVGTLATAMEIANILRESGTPPIECEIIPDPGCEGCGAPPEGTAVTEAYIPDDESFDAMCAAVDYLSGPDSDTRRLLNGGSPLPEYGTEFTEQLPH
jgi:hypothetical protein